MEAEEAESRREGGESRGHQNVREVDVRACMGERAGLGHTQSIATEETGTDGTEARQ